MKNIMLYKRIFAFFLALILVLSLAACTSSGASSSGIPSSESSTTDSSEEDEESAVEPVSDEVVTLTLWEYVADIERTAPGVYLCVKQFMEDHPNVIIDMVGTASEEHNKKVLLASQSGDLPDMTTLEWSMMRELKAEGFLADLTDEVYNRGIDDFFVPGVLQLEEDNTIYGLPYEACVCCYFYNKEIFDQYNVGYPDVEEWNWDEFINNCQVFVENGVTPVMCGGLSPWNIGIQQSFLVRYGFPDYIEKINSGEMSWVNDDFLHFFEKMQEYGEKNMMPSNVTTMDYFQALDQWIGGTGAMVSSGVWAVNQVAEAEFADQIGVWHGPVFEDGVGDKHRTVKSGTICYGVTAKCAEDTAKFNAAMDFFEFFYGEEGTRIHYEEGNTLTVTKYSGDKSKLSPLLQNVGALVDDDWTGYLLCTDMMPAGTADVFYDAVWGVMLGNYTPQQAAEQMQAEYDS